ncbi:MAG: repeat-containing protein [Bryobacterales bacterium]|nr:repeat-containing protein [Bryobacterales bacterium]
MDAARRGENEAAVRTLREAVQLRPDAPIAHYNLGLVLADRGELTAARAQVVQAISLSPTEARFYLALGRMWNREGNSQRARAALQRASELDPTNGMDAAELRNLNSRAASRVAEDDPYRFGALADTADAHFTFATVLARRGDWTGAAGEWLRVLALRPDDVDARNNLGVSYARAGEDGPAELEFRKALLVSAASAGAHFGLAMLELQHGNQAAAVQELREVTRLQPEYPQAQSLLTATLKESK